MVFPWERLSLLLSVFPNPLCCCVSDFSGLFLKPPCPTLCTGFPLCLTESFRVQIRERITAPTCPNAYRCCQRHFCGTIQASPLFRPRTIYKGRSLPGDAGENGLPAWVVWGLGAQTRGRMTSWIHRLVDEAESGPSMWLELPASFLPEPSTGHSKGFLKMIF